MADATPSPFPIARARAEALSVPCPHPGCSAFMIAGRTGTETIRIPEFNRTRGTVTTCDQCRETYRIHEERGGRRR